MRNEDKFWSKFTAQENGCLLWTGSVVRGYGQWHVHCFDPLKPVHRLAYCLYHNVTMDEISREPIKQTCGNPLCCAKEHLVKVTWTTIRSTRKNDNAKKSSYRFAPSYA